MKIDEREVPAPVVARWKQAPNNASSAALKTLASVHPSLQAGFRPGKVSPAEASERVEAYCLELRHPVSDTHLVFPAVDCLVIQYPVSSHRLSGTKPIARLQASIQCIAYLRTAPGARKLESRHNLNWAS